MAGGNGGLQRIGAQGLLLAQAQRLGPLQRGQPAAVESGLTP